VPRPEVQFQRCDAENLRLPRQDFGIQGKDVTLAVAGETADDAAKARVLADLNFLIGEGYIAKLHDSRLFAQPVLSTQAQAKEEAANEDATEEK